jgi:molecular chaperone DnaK
MRHYVGIDLGTTNSAICSFDGENTRLYQSPDQQEVTPSAIFITSRGSRYIGKRAYDQAARAPDNSATLFKRLMGTSTPMKMSAVNVTMTPEECSAEILRALYGYLPEEIRNDPDTGTVITVPAAFNQMQKDATMSAAELAGIGKVALMQEPVAAVMSVMRESKDDGVFLIYDFGGGTLDIAIAQSISGRVNLLGAGGIQMCGGRDFDRMLRDSVVAPWLVNNFDLPDDLAANTQYRSLNRLVEWSAEQAKIELSRKEEAVITMDDSELAMRDRQGKDLYLDVPISRARFNDLISITLDQSIGAVRETLEKAGISPRDVGRIVFVGGPTQYKPLRDTVAFQLGIPPSTNVKPMTAVAEGAAIFAESIDWSSQSRGRKKSRGAISAGGRLDLVLNFIARTPDHKARVALKVSGETLLGTEIQIDSLDTGWSSGRSELTNGGTLEVPLSKAGENAFKIFVFDAQGGSIALKQDRFAITRTAASIDAIPASHSIGIEVKSRAGGSLVLEYLVKEGEQLPKMGKLPFKAETSLKAQSPGSINFKIWEGNIADPITDNRFIGMFKIRGRDFDEGVIAAGDPLICEYEVLDSGNIKLEVSVPSIGGSFPGSRNYYSRQEGLRDLSKSAQQIEDDVASMIQRVDETAAQIKDDRLDQARERLSQATNLRGDGNNPESAGEAVQHVHEAKKLLARARKDNLRAIRKLDLDKVVEFFGQHIKQFARPTEVSAFDNLVGTARRAIDSNSHDFEGHLDDLRGRNFSILWRQDWFVIDRFKWLAQGRNLFPNADEHILLIDAGNAALKADEIDKLRLVVAQMDSIRVGSGGDDDMLVATNIVRG